MRVSYAVCLAASATLFGSSAMAAGCQLQQIGTLPIDMRGLRPLISTKINGTKAYFILDSGSVSDLIWRGAAARYRLPVSPVRGDSLYVSGIGGSEKADETTVRSFEFLGFPLSNAKFLVVGGGGGSEGEPAGVIGQNLLRMSDVEYDLANGVVRFFKPVGCNGRPLAYWAVSTPYTSVKLRAAYLAEYHLSATAIVDGHRMTVWFDTGSPRSYLSLTAAARIGITPHSPGVKFLGTGGGIGGGIVKMWLAPVQSFQLGGEKVEHAHLLMAHLNYDANYDARMGIQANEFPDMVLGDDFFLSHRIFVAYSQSKIYFTYNGGPLFNLNLPQVIAGKAPPPATAGTDSVANAKRGGLAESEANTAADVGHLRRRGMAYAAMQRFDLALADLTRACQLAPSDARNHYDRGLVYAQDKRFKSALKDFDVAISLQSDDVDAHLARARLLQSQPQADAAVAAVDIKADLDAISKLSAPDAGVRLRLGDLYGNLGDYRAAVGQIDQWLQTHPLKGDQATGLAARCWVRARTNRHLHAALDDCNRSLDRTPGGLNIDTLDSRGLVYLRLGRPKAAISDYNAALDFSPAMATALYGRGLAELRLGRKARAQKDLSAAENRDSGIARYFARMGLSP